MTDASGNTGTSSCESPGRGRGGRGSAEVGGSHVAMETTPFPGRCGVGRVGGAQTHSTISSCNFMTASFRFVRVCCFSLPQKRRMSHSPSPSARPRRRSDSIASHKTIIKEAIRVAKLATPPPACKCGSGRARRSAPAWLSLSLHRMFTSSCSRFREP